jgi:hypothetical protein
LTIFTIYNQKVKFYDRLKQKGLIAFLPINAEIQIKENICFFSD